MLYSTSRASSTTVFPPPIHHSQTFKEKPSHVAQAETPLPKYCFSELRPRYLADAPVAMIKDSEE